LRSFRTDRFFGQIVPEDNESPMTSYQNRSASHDHLPSYYDTATRYYFKNHDVSDRSILPDAYPSRSNSSILHPDLSRALRVDAHLLAIVRIEDRRNNLYATEVVNKLRQKELTQSFINKPCSLYITDRALKIVDRMSQNVAESIPLENIDPTCLESETPDTLNDIFMYRLYERHSNQLNNSTHSTNSYDRMSTVVVFKCSNKESKVLVDSIRSAAAKQLRQPRSARSESRTATTNRTGPMPFYAPPPAQTIVTDPPAPPPMTPRAAEDHYKRLTIDLNKCFDDIELFVRHLEVVTGYTRELERSRRKGKKNHPPNTTIDELPEDKYFVDILQKFKHSFNLIGELKHIIHNPNGPELIHYLLSPLQFILVSLRQKHPNQAQLAQSIRTPVLIKDARELLVNCLTSREHDIIKNLGPAWLPANDETTARPTDYRPIFFDGREPWTRTDFDAIPSARTMDDRRSPAPLPTSARSNPTRHVSPSVGRNETSTIDRSMREAPAEIYTPTQQNEHSWAIERKRAGAKICAVKNERPGHNPKELSVRRGELIEILDDSKNWWRARNFQGKIGHVPNNILEEIDIEQRSLKNPSTNPSGIKSHRPLTETISRSRHK